VLIQQLYIILKSLYVVTSPLMTNAGDAPDLQHIEFVCIQSDADLFDSVIRLQDIHIMFKKKQDNRIANKIKN